MRSPVDAYLEELHARFRLERSGEVATYIRELGRADPESFGICLAMTDGRVYEVGDTRRPFTLQSMSKPFTYGLALQDRGGDAVAAKIDVEPSGDAFNSISLEPGTGRPRNPMINAGAIAAASLVAGASVEERSDRILEAYGRFAGRPLSVDEAVFTSERDTGDRNLAIGHMLRSFEILGEPADRMLDVYFRQCSVVVDCRDAAIMAATLANGGRNPITGERALQEGLVERVLSVMVTCGMYDGSGRWVDTVGLPAKSGVSGGILAVLPGQLAISVFSPPLDEHGNSVRGVGVCQTLARDFHLHSLRVARSARSTIRASYDVASAPSRRRRPQAQAQALERLGARGVVFELQGDLLFAGTERVVRIVEERCDTLDAVVLDLRSVDRLEASAARTLLRLRAELLAVGKDLAFVANAGQAELTAAATEHASADLATFAVLDDAREWCEEQLLARTGLSDPVSPPVTLAHHPLCRGLDGATIADLRALLRQRQIAAGEQIVSAGDAATELFLLLAGEVMISVTLDADRHRRLVSLPPGSTFGQLALSSESPRQADVTAARDSTLMVLENTAFEQLADTNPRLQAQLLRNLLKAANELIGRMTLEVLALGRGD